MRVLMVYPLFPKTFWSFERVLALVDRKVMIPPLGLVTVAALLPQEWEFKLVDRNVRDVTEDEWAWADMVMLSAMIVQRNDFAAQIREAKRRGKPVAVGGPFPTSCPDQALEAGADFLVLDEGEITIPRFLAALERGEKGGIFTAEGEKPDVTQTPVPRFDLLDLDKYDTMPIQYSRGCPFQCEFCDIITLYGRRPRTKAPEQIIAELDRLVELGWNRGIFMVDDNFIGNKKNVKVMLRALVEWQARKEYPFFFCTEASVDLAKDDELMELMVESRFNAVFLGIETPDPHSLEVTKKYQNMREPLEDSVEKITRKGLRVMAGFIIGFDGEPSGAGKRLIEFVERTAISTAIFSMLQALPHTGLWHRLEREGRLFGMDAALNQTNLTNFVPTRPIEELAQEHIEAFWECYDPIRYLDRTYRNFLKLGPPRHFPRFSMPPLAELRAFLVVCWRQGVQRATRWKFWHHLVSIARRNPKNFDHYFAVCAHYEHFMEYRELVRAQIESQLATVLARRAAGEIAPVAPAPVSVPARAATSPA